MLVVVMMVFLFMRVRADFHVATATTAATFLTHIMKSPRRRFPVPARAATRRLHRGNGDIR